MTESLGVWQQGSTDWLLILWFHRDKIEVSNDQLKASVWRCCREGGKDDVADFFTSCEGQTQMQALFEEPAGSANEKKKEPSPIKTKIVSQERQNGKRQV